MKCLDKFNNKMRLGGGSLRDESIKSNRDFLRETFADDASFASGVYMWELGSLGIDSYTDKETIDIRIYNRTFSNANGVMRHFQTMMDTPIVVGDVVYDSNADEYLICTESHNISDIHWQGKLTLCNWILRWQDKNGDILEYPCHDINTTQYNSGEQSNRQFTIGSSQHMITMPYDENTVSLKTPQRFFLDRDTANPTSFVVTQNDTTSYGYGKKGLVKVTVTECASNSDTDRIDLGICDYREKRDVANDNSNGSFKLKSVISYDTKIIKSGGNRQTFIGGFFDGNGVEVTGMTPHWEIVGDFNDALDVEEVGNEITIGIDDDNYVDEEFKIVLTDEEGNYPSHVIVKIESLL